MQKLLLTMCVSVVTVVFATDSFAADRSGGVSVGRDGASVSASRDGASVRGGGASVSASRGGASVRGGGASVTASRDGASVRGGGASVTASADDHPAGSVNAGGDREYDDLASWMEDLGRWWSGSDTQAERTVGSESTSISSSVEQVSEATATSTDGEPAVAEARNSKVTTQNP